MKQFSILLILLVGTFSLPVSGQVKRYSGSDEVNGPTRPIQYGTSLPGTCSVGNLYYKTDATAGQNLYGCTATNTWTVEAGGGSSTGTTLPQITGTFPGTTATVGATCLAGTATCGGLFGITPRIWSTAPTIVMTGGSGTGTAYVYMVPAGTVTISHPVAFTFTVGSGVTDDPTTLSAFPSNVKPMYTFALSGTSITSITNVSFPESDVWTAGSGPWTVTPTATGFQGACATCADTAGTNTFLFKQTMTTTSTSAGLNLGTLAGDPSPCSNGDVWYNTSTNKYRACVSSAAADLGGGTATQTYYPNDTFVSCVTNTSAQIQNIRTNASVAALCTASNDENVGLLPFAASVNYHMSKELPPNWTGSVTLKIFWSTWTGGSSEQVRFTTATTCISANETFDSPTYNTAVNTDRNVPTTVRTKDQFTVTLNVTGCSTGDTLLVKLTRGTPPGTDYGNVPYLVGAEWGIAHN